MQLRNGSQESWERPKEHTVLNPLPPEKRSPARGMRKRLHLAFSFARRPATQLAAHWAVQTLLGVVLLGVAIFFRAIIPSHRQLADMSLAAIPVMMLVLVGLAIGFATWAVGMAMAISGLVLAIKFRWPVRGTGSGLLLAGAIALLVWYIALFVRGTP